MGWTALHHPHHERDVAGAVLDADDARELGEPPDRRHVDRAGEHRDVVERDVDRRVQGDLAEVGVDRLGAELVVKRRDDRDGAGAELVVRLAGGDRFADVGLGRPREHRHAAAGLVADDLDDPPALFGGEARELAGRAVGVQAVDAVVDQPIDVAAQLGLVDVAVIVERDEVGGEDAFHQGAEVRGQEQPRSEGRGFAVRSS